MKFLPKLGIRGKILTSVTIFLVLFFMIESILLYQIFLNGFKYIEEHDMVTDVQRVEGLLDDQIDNYSLKLSNWSSWDDTYNFIINKNQTYIDSNLTGSSIANIQLNFMFFIASGGAIVEEKGINYQTGEKISIPKDLHDLLSKSNYITTHKTEDSNSKGIIRISNGNILFASKPILNSFSKGPIRGTLVFARYIDEQLLDKIAKLERSKIEIQDYYSTSLPDDFEKAKILMKTKGVQYKEPNGYTDNYYINIEGLNVIDGYTYIYDINKKPAFIIENKLERPYYSLGINLILTVLGIFIFIGACSIFFSYTLLNNLVIAKIRKLNKDVSLISDPNSPQKSLEFNGRDEFSEVADNINKMLVGISKSQESLRESDNALQKEKEALNKKVLELERFNQLTIGRELKMIELKKEIEQLKNGGV